MKGVRSWWLRNWRSPRSFTSSNAPTAADDGPIAGSPPVDIFQGIKDSVDKKSGFRQWLAEIKAKLEAQPKGPVWFGGGPGQPFPHNPDFRPMAPITEALRDRLYKLHLSDPAKWTPRQLSSLFKVSIPRVKAVIRLKEAEIQRLADGSLKLDPEYVARMEEHLDAKAPVSVPEEVTPVNPATISNRLRPRLVAIPENSELSPQEAAKILGLKAAPREKSTLNEEPVSTTEGPERKHGVFIRFDAYEQGRSPFYFVDMSRGQKPAARQVLFRQSNGDLRTATFPERMHVARRVWGKSANRFIS